MSHRHATRPLTPPSRARKRTATNLRYERMSSGCATSLSSTSRASLRWLRFEVRSPGGTLALISCHWRTRASQRPNGIVRERAARTTCPDLDPAGIKETFGPDRDPGARDAHHGGPPQGGPELDSGPGPWT